MADEIPRHHFHPPRGIDPAFALCQTMFEHSVSGEMGDARICGKPGDDPIHAAAHEEPGWTRVTEAVASPAYQAWSRGEVGGLHAPVPEALHPNTEAWMKAKKERIARLVANGASVEEIWDDGMSDGWRSRDRLEEDRADGVPTSTWVVYATATMANFHGRGSDNRPQPGEG